MNVLMTGATGFVGERVLARLSADGHQVTALGRRAPAGASKFHRWDSSSSTFPEPALQGMDAVIHLAGEPVSQRWNREVKRRIRESRVTGTRALVAAMRKIPKPPQTLVSASAVGYYGDRGEELLNESSPPGAGFLPEVTVDWEHAALDAQALGVRVVPLRIGIVLGPGGALKMMLPPFRMGVGGPLGSGRQWMSWIHVDDLVDLILFAFNLDRLSGPINAVSPVPLRNSEFTQALGSAVHRPAFFPVPKLALSVLFGEMAGVMLSSQRVVPNAAELARFPFRYRDVQPALKAAVASFRT